MVDEHGFQVRVAVVLAGLVVLIVFVEGGKFLQPLVDVLDQAAFVIVDFGLLTLTHGLFDLGDPVGALEDFSGFGAVGRAYDTVAFHQVD